MATKKCRKGAEHRLVSVPMLGDFLKGSASVQYVAEGAVVGLLGQGAVKHVLGATGVLDKLPSFVLRFLPTLAGFASGYAMSEVDKRFLKWGHKARGHLVGATLAGAAINAWDELRAWKPDMFNDYVTVSYGRYGRYAGTLVADPRLAGTLVADNRGSQANLSSLQAFNLATAEADDGI